MRTTAIAAAFVLAVSTPSIPLLAQTTSAPTASQKSVASKQVEDLNSILSPIRKKHNLVALGGTIVEGDHVIAIGAVGHRKKGSPEKVTTSDLWHLGSDTKAMTATLCAILVEQGKLRWDITLAEVFPELSEKMHPDFRGVTLEQLLQHRAGLPSQVLPRELWKSMWAFDGEPREARRKVLEQMLSVKPEHPPGTKFEYSNVGYIVAGAMTEKVMDQPWETLMRQMIFSPLNMFSADFGPPGEPGKITQPWGHSKGMLKTEPIEPGPRGDNPPVMGPAGRVHCSLEDWARFVSLHLAGECKAARLLKPDTFKKLHEPPSGGDYALGWIVTDRKWGGRVFTHAGSNTMWYCVAWVAPEKNFAVLVTCNQAGGDTARACDEAAGVLIKHYTSKRQSDSAIERELGGADVVEAIRRPDQVRAYLIDPLPKLVKENGAKLKDYPVRGEVLTVDKDCAKRLSSILLNSGSYKDGKKKCIPTYGTGVQFIRGDRSVDVLFCFECDMLIVAVNGEFVSGANFDPIHRKLASWFKARFPNDKVIQSL